MKHHQLRIRQRTINLPNTSFCLFAAPVVKLLLTLGILKIQLSDICSQYRLSHIRITGMNGELIVHPQRISLCQ